jgi:hypothetical protein
MARDYVALYEYLAATADDTFALPIREDTAAIASETAGPQRVG